MQRQHESGWNVWWRTRLADSKRQGRQVLFLFVSLARRWYGEPVDC